MAGKYHLKSDGTPGRCVARTLEACRASGYTLDFHGTLEEVRAESERLLSAEHGEVAPAASKQASGTTVAVEDRRAFSTDMSDPTEYRVEGGRVKALFEGDDYDLGELRAIPEEEFKSWNRSSFGDEVNFQDGELYPIYNGNGEEDGVMARFGDSYYRTGTTTDYYDAFHTSATDSAPNSLDLSKAELSAKLSSRDFSGLKGIAIDDPREDYSLTQVIDWQEPSIEEDEGDGRFLRVQLTGNFRSKNSSISEPMVLWLSERDGSAMITDIEGHTGDIHVDPEALSPLFAKLKL